MNAKLRWMVMLVFPLLMLTCCFPWHMMYWAEWKPMTLPDGHGELILLTKGLHPYLAESSRRIHIRTASVDRIVDLPDNVGGQDVIEAYWHPANGQRGPFVRLADDWGEYLLDLSKGRSYALRWIDFVLYAGDSTDSGGYSSWVHDSFNGKPALRIDGMVSESRGQHIGRFE